MHKRKRIIWVSALISLSLLAALAFLRSKAAAPRKPDPIPAGDYTYVAAGGGGLLILRYTGVEAIYLLNLPLVMRN